MVKSKGWRKEPYRHGLSSKGIKTASPTIGKPLTCIPLQNVDDRIVQQIKEYNEMAGGKEWIAEFDCVNGHIIMNDFQFSQSFNDSWLAWDDGDEFKNIGYIHYHPPHLHPMFSVQDFILVAILHEKRVNKGKCPYTFMGLVTDDFVKVVAVNPSPRRKNQFERYVLTDGEPRTREALTKVLDDMKKKGELVEMEEIPLKRNHEPMRGLIV